MSPRIWPGALCVITASEYRANVGRIVLVVSLGSRDPLAWNGAAQGEPLMVWDMFRDCYPSREAVALDNCLRPILPPPESETTDDRAPCETEAA